MPLSIQIPYKGSDYLFQGISSAGAGLATGIEQMTANLKKAKAYRAMAVDALGMDPDAVDHMSLPELEGHFQATALKSQMASAQAMREEHAARMQELLAQASERQQKTQLQGEEAEAWPQLMQNIMQGRAAAGPAQAPDEDAGPDIWTSGTGSAPSGPVTPQEIMAGMAQMGKTSPRLAASLSRTLIPQLMQPTTGPQSYLSQGGNRFVYMGHTLMPDRAGMDPSQMMEVPGYTPVQTGNNKVQYLKTTPQLPTEFHSTMDKIGEDIASAQATLGQPDSAFVDANGKQQSADYIKTMKGYAQKRLTAAQARGKATVDRYHSTGYLSPEQKDSMYGELGIEAPAAKAATPAAGGGKQLTKAQAAQFLQDAKGDKDKARELAKKAGFTF